MQDNRIQEIRERADAYFADHDMHDCAGDIYWLIDQLAEAQRRERALLADLKEACATTCGFCKHAEYHPMRGSYPGKPCPGNQNDCNGECQNFEWRGPQAGRGEAE